MPRNVMAMYRDRGVAETVVDHLRESGTPPERIRVVTHGAADRYRALASTSDLRRERKGARGAAVGLLLGVLLGALTSVVLAAFPAIGWVFAADALGSIIVTALIGGAIGTLVGWAAGALPRAGIPFSRSHPHAEALRHHGALVVVEARGRQARRVSRLMKEHQPLDLDRRARPVPPSESEGIAPRAEERAEEKTEPTAAEEGPPPEAPAPPPHEEPAQAEEPTQAPRRRPPLDREPLGAQREPGLSFEESDRTRQHLPEEELAAVEPRLRQHFETHHADRGERWAVHREAYELGLRLVRDRPDKERVPPFHDLESLARLRWESSSFPQVPFHRVRDSIEYGYEEGRLVYA